jgi:outer membrane biosynthesis protein TonB
MLTHFSFKNSHSVSRLGRTAAVLTFVVLILVGVPICDAQQAPGNYVGPKLLSSEQPEYVGEAKDAGVEGTVTVHVKIDDAGNVIIADDPHGLGRACGIVDFQPILKLYQSVIDSVKKSKFEPATRDGRPVESEIWINSTFKLSDDPAAANAPLPPNVSKKKAKDPFEKRLKSMPKPEYPKAALAVRAVGSVPVRVVVDD